MEKVEQMIAIIAHWKKVSSKITISYLIKGEISKQLLVENWNISFKTLQKYKVLRESINKVIELKI